LAPSGRRVLSGAFVLAGVLMIGLFGLYLRGPQAPEGATPLSITTRSGVPLPALGCAAALLSPVRIQDVGVVAEFRFVDTGEAVKIVWPPGYRAWSVDGQAVLVNNFGVVVMREGEQLVNLGANEMDDGSRWVCADASWVPELQPLEH
jgi:hypothetical protein